MGRTHYRFDRDGGQSTVQGQHAASDRKFLSQLTTTKQKHMKKFALSVIVLALSLAGCKTTGTSSITTQITSQLTPQTLAKGAQDVLAAGGSAILAKNPSYTADVSAAADVFTAIATSNPAALSGADVEAALSKSSVSAANQKAIAVYVNAALGLYESDFKISFPALQPNYALFATAIANGLNVASGNASKVVALPTS